MTLVVGINGSPRRGWNTSTLVSDALEGAASAGAETRMVDLYSLGDVKGCVSCFGCKRIGLEEHRCVHRDGLTPVLDLARGADALVLGSPVYFSQVTSGLAAFVERLYFPYVTYSAEVATFCDRRVPTAFIYTMNMDDEWAERLKASYRTYENLAGGLFGCEPMSYLSTDTWQYPDYSRYEHSRFDVEAKRARRETQFPRDREACREMGRRLAESASAARTEQR